MNVTRREHYRTVLGSRATTLKWYAKYIPGSGERWADLLDGVGGTKTWNHEAPERPGAFS